MKIAVSITAKIYFRNVVNGVFVQGKDLSVEAPPKPDSKAAAFPPDRYHTAARSH